MLRFYAPIFILQAFCLYHAYKNNSNQKWFYLILFFPLIGCLIYLYDAFYSRDNIKGVTEGVKKIVNSNYHIERLEKELKFNDNIINKTRLAEAYTQVGRFSESVQLYELCLDGFMSDDIDLQMKLMHAYYSNEDYDLAISIGKKLEGDKSFKNSFEKVAYAWAHHHTGKVSEADSIFREMDKPFTNYAQRLEYFRFLLENDRKDELKGKIKDFLHEYEHMSSVEKKVNRAIVSEIKKISNSIERKTTEPNQTGS